MDFLRKVAISRGNILFCEEDSAFTSEKEMMIRECLLVALSVIFQSSAYEAYTLIKSQVRYISNCYRIFSSILTIKP
jgi:hypothetical protein